LAPRGAKAISKEFVGTSRMKTRRRAPRNRAPIQNAAEQLADHPHLGRPWRVEGRRELVIADTPFILVYRVLNNCVRILSVIHGARRWPERF